MPEKFLIISCFLRLFGGEVREIFTEINPEKTLKEDYGDNYHVIDISDFLLFRLYEAITNIDINEENIPEYIKKQVEVIPSDDNDFELFEKLVKEYRLNISVDYHKAEKEFIESFNEELTEAIFFEDWSEMRNDLKGNLTDKSNIASFVEKLSHSQPQMLTITPELRDRLKGLSFSLTLVGFWA